MTFTITQKEARAMCLKAQRLGERAPFGSDTLAAITHLGYVQIDTINVIERAHHHILWTRVPSYQKEHLNKLLSVDKSIFEYWDHALAYLPMSAYPHFQITMRRYEQHPMGWFSSVTKEEAKRVLNLIKREGPLCIRDIKDEAMVEKDHEWASRKPSKRVMQYLFFAGKLTVSKREGMLKYYDLTDRHFDWDKRPKASTPKEQAYHLLERAITSQGPFTLESAAYLKPKQKAELRKVLEVAEKKGLIHSFAVKGVAKEKFWATPQALEEKHKDEFSLIHLLSPFDPLIIQRKRLVQFFDQDYKFEAYVPEPKRKYGYFALPVLYGDEFVAYIDLKTDRLNKKMLIQKWTWVKGFESKSLKAGIEQELARFEKFQLGK